MAQMAVLCDGGLGCAGAVTAGACVQCAAGSYQTGSGPPWQHTLVCMKSQLEAAPSCLFGSDGNTLFSS